MNEKGAYKLCFLAGYEESGESALCDYLSFHPSIVTIPNLAIFDDIFAWRRTFGHRLPLINFILSRKLDLLEECNIDPIELRRKMISASSEASMLKILMESFVCKEGVKIILEKAPGKARYFDKISRLFPDSHFIYLVRDGREVVAENCIKYKCDKWQYLIHLSRWIISAKMFFKFSQGKVYSFVKWEDFVNDNQKVSKKILQDLYLDYVDLAFNKLKIPQNLYKQTFNERDRMVIEYYLRSMLDLFAYPTEFSQYKISLKARILFRWFYVKSFVYFWLKRWGLEFVYYFYRLEIKKPVKSLLCKLTLKIKKFRKYEQA